MQNLKRKNHFGPPNDFAFYQALIGGMEDVVISADKNFIITSINEAAEKIFGISTEQAIGKNTADVLNLEYLNISRQAIMEILSKEGFWKGIVRTTTNNNNQTIYLQNTYTTYNNEQGERIGYVAVMRNITDEYKKQQSLKNFISILSFLEDTFLIVDKQYHIIFLSPKSHLKEYFGTDFKIGDLAFKYVLEDYLEEVKSAYEKTFNGETIKYYNKYQNNNKEYFFEVTYTPLKDDFENISSICIIIKDITTVKEVEKLETEKKKTEQKLYESRKLFEEFIQKSPLLATVTDKNGIVKYISNPYAELADLNNIINKSLFEIFNKENAEAYHINNLKVINEKTILEKIETGSGHRHSKTYKTIRFPINYNNETMVAGWTIDISDQINIQKELRQLNEHKDKLVSIIAHDLRGPLGINASFLKSIIDDYEHYNKEELLTSLQLLSKSTSKSFTLVDDMLRWAKGQLSQISFHPKAINVQAEISKVIDSIWEQLREKNIAIKTQFKYAENIFVDHDMFSIVVRNLITNAVKFSYPDSTIVIKTRLLSKKEAIVIVQDFGIGMKEELIEKLLQKSNFESTYGTKGETGTGLGLIIAKDYIEKNGGTMLIESTEKKGSKFCFTVPINIQAVD